MNHLRFSDKRFNMIASLTLRMSDDSQESFPDVEQEEIEELVDKSSEELTDAEKTSKIKLSVRRSYDAPEWSIVFELASPDGRRADAIAVNTFPSRNFKIIGFEFKASRSDWLSEKNEGAKADYFVTLCDEWYIVAWPGVVKEEELPEGWGLLELKPNSEQLWTEVESNLTEYQQGEPDRAFWGRFVQKTVGSESNYTQQDIKEARKRGYEEGVEYGKEYGSDVEDRQIKRKAERWDALEDAGIDWLYNVSDDEVQQLKDARKLLQLLDEDGYQSLRNEFDRILNSVTEFQHALERLEVSLSYDDPSLEILEEENATDDEELNGQLEHDGCGGDVVTDYEEGKYGTSYYCEDCEEKIHPTEVSPREE